MGIDINAAQLLLRSRQLGVCFEKTATLGRQHLHLEKRELLSVLRGAGGEDYRESARQILDSPSRHADPFLRSLGAREIVAIDASDYEGAQIVHDMNLPIDDGLANSFDVVFDGGTLEHVFNFPVGMANAMRMVKPGRHYIGFTPANNFFGHGFYQFSAELYYRVLSPANGFQVEQMIVWEEVRGSSFFGVADPETVRSRIEFLTTRPAYLYVQARKTGDVRPFSRYPQQSDYQAQWKDKDAAADPQLPDRWPFRLRKLVRRMGLSRALASVPLALQIREWVFRTGQLRENVRGYCRPLPAITVR